MADEGTKDGAPAEAPALLYAKLGILTALVTAIVGALVLPGYRLVWLATVAIGFVPPGLWWLKPAIQRWPRWRVIGPWLMTISIVALAAVLITIIHHNSSNSADIRTGQPPQAHENAAAPIVITSPSDPDHVGGCLTLALSGKVPAGEELVVANQLQGSDQRYFKPASPGID